ncbi:MAG: hypothetical protein M1495_17140 [Bacteroidetes bacterium]|nr:hypothetical protein [Bacteroidota bacterium]
MARKSFHFSSGFIQKMIELTEGVVPSDTFEKVIRTLETDGSKFHISQSSESNLVRIFSAIFDKVSFLHELILYPHHSEIISAIAASSNFLTDIAVQNPEYLYQVFDQDYLSKKIDYTDLEKEITEGISKFKSFNARLNFLRQIKKRFILKIGLTDILGLDQLLSITQQLSFLAKAINGRLFEICFSEVQLKYTAQPNERKYCLCSLGKLGGGELNYSSDVDLILFYDSNATLTGTNKDFHELLSESVQLFAKSSTDISDRGYIYRVDFRLRPDGKYSPLCKAIGDYIKYYETRGEDWERQMLIKLDYVCGDQSLYNKFHSFVQQYVFSSLISTSVKEKIRTMKSNIERQYPEKDNVKTFTGGIRDIEFTVQALQLLNGAKLKSLRSGNSLLTIEELTKNKLLNKNEKKILSDSYIFYRRIEHFLQLMNDTQTHVIPDDLELQQKLVVFLKLESIKELREKIHESRQSVRKIYNKVLASEAGQNKTGAESVRFKDNTKAEKNLSFLRTGMGIIDRKEFDSRTIELFNSLETNLYGYLKKCSDPDRVLENFVKIIRATKFPSIWYGEFANKRFFENFLRICLYSQKSVDLISTDSNLEEFFLTRKVFLKKPDDELQNFSLSQLFLLLSVQLTSNLITARGVSELITKFVTAKINSAAEKFHSPCKFFIAGLGSFGCESMNFASDIDLVLVVDSVTDHPDIQNQFTNLIQQLRETLQPFEVDFRLRPEGKKSPIVWDIINYKDYLEKRARIWEFQSLLKLRYVSGDKMLFDEFEKLVLDSVKNLPQDKIREEMRTMYSTILRQQIRTESSGFDIKKDAGGLQTINFLVQYLCLSNAKLFAKCSGKNFEDMIKTVKTLLTQKDHQLLSSNWKELRKIELSIQTVFNTENTKIPDDSTKKKLLAEFLKYSEEGLTHKVKEVVKSNNLLLKKFLGS